MTTKTGDSMHQQLCLSCGLCCNGVIFADVQLRQSDNAGRLRELGLPLRRGRAPRADAADAPNAQVKDKIQVGLKFAQPCAALNGCACRIYAERPTYCRQFECLLLKKVKSGQTAWDTAEKIITDAQERVTHVLRLLRALGDKQEEVALHTRFRRVSAALQRAEIDEKTTAVFGELTLAVHALNCLLSESFYPGP